MAFYKKTYNKKTEVYYPRAITIGTAINTDQIAEALADRSTVTKTDVKAVLTEMADVMSQYMAPRQKRKTGRTRLFPIRTEHKRREKRRRLRFPDTTATRKSKFHPRDHLSCFYRSSHPQYG